MELLCVSINLLDYFRFIYEDSTVLGRYKGYEQMIFVRIKIHKRKEEWNG